MHHLIVFLPIFGLVVFLFLPLNLAIPVYLGIVLLSGLMYWILFLAMKKRSKSGVEGLTGAEARVVSKLGPHEEAQYLVKIRGELWSANSRDDLKPGDVVTVLSVDGLTLLVGKAGVSRSS